MTQLMEFDHLTLLEGSVVGVGHSDMMVTGETLHTLVLRLPKGEEVTLNYSIKESVDDHVADSL